MKNAVVWDMTTLCDGRSVGIVRLRLRATEFVLFLFSRDRAVIVSKIW
jgi:hypothetical protein